MRARPSLPQRRAKIPSLRTVLIALYAAAVILIAPAGASAAWNVYHGDDYDRVWTDRSRHKTCDEEADSHTVYGIAKNTNDNEDKRVVSGAGSCETSGDFGYIYKHRVCETQFGPWPNDCSGWQYTD